MKNSSLRSKINNHLKNLKEKTTTYKSLAIKFNSHPRAIARILALSIQKNVTIKIKIFNPNKEVGGFKVVTLNKNNKNILSSPTVRPLAYYSDNAPGKIKLIQAWFNGIKEKLYGNQDTDGDISSRN